MTRAHYYASTVRNLKDVANYAIYPVAKVCGYLLFKGNDVKATALASVVTTGFYGALTTNFFGKESRMLDIVAREAVAAELGIEPEEVQFVDYWRSKNHVIRQECADIDRLTKVRYLTDALFLAPLATSFATRAIPGMDKMTAGRGSRKGKQSFMDAFGISDLALSIGYAGKAAYWYEETFNVGKTGLYEFVKWHELGVSLGKDISCNDLLSLVQRTRDDRHLPRLNRAERQALRPLLDLLAAKYNYGKNTDVNALLYIIGNDLIRIHDDAGRVSRGVMEESAAAIEHIDRVGLRGIREENRGRGRGEEGQADIPPTGFVQRLGNNLLPRYRAKVGQDLEEHISSRDPGEFVYTGNGREID